MSEYLLFWIPLNLVIGAYFIGQKNYGLALVIGLFLSYYIYKAWSLA